MAYVLLVRYGKNYLDWPAVTGPFEFAEAAESEWHKLVEAGEVSESTHDYSVEQLFTPDC